MQFRNKVPVNTDFETIISFVNINIFFVFKFSDSGNNLGTSSTRSGLSMQDELRSVLDLMIKEENTLEIHTTPDVYITQNSSPRDVKKWLRDKEFSQR